MPIQIVMKPEKGPVNRHEISMRLYRLISDISFLNSFKEESLFTALITGVGVGKKNQSKIEDVNRTPLTYRQFIVHCFILGRQIKKQTKLDEYVGIMLPTTNVAMMCFFALQAYRRIPAMVNFTMGFYNLYSACQTTKIKIIYTARQFIESAKLESLVDELASSGITIKYLEDFKANVHLGNKLSGLLKGVIPTLAYKIIGPKVSPDQPGIALFTSGSEGTPKSVVLSHANLLANCCQMKARVDFSPQDLFFNALPIFHCFGLTAGSLVPLLSGINCFFYPSPLHYKIIPGLVYQLGATIMFGTDTFLNGYARAANANDFSSVRYVFAGAEKVKPETIRYWIEHFGVKIYEGYGTTETAPVISLNCPLASAFGTVGMLLPLMSSRIEPVAGIAEGGRLFLRGPNVMKGYMDSRAPGTIISLPQGWHDTGDIVTIDKDDFITIAGRAKRFAKIAGEMISLTLVEGVAASVWPDKIHAAIVRTCARKGEKIILFTEEAPASRSVLIKKM
jgi:acyl-[acyl-carrier-protein]-phospholipid O-acyltransferase/long-chain-fatty-acid--[acyl-carrier-protein] ligase